MKDVLFVHIPRTGGRSIRRVFDEVRVDNRKIITFENWGHWKLYSETAKERNDSFKFAFVRNPWTRMASMYHAHLAQAKGGEYTSEFKQILQNRNFLEYLNYIKTFSDIVPNRSIKAESEKTKGFIIIKSQLWYIQDERKTTVDFIGRYENLHEDLTIVMEKLGIDAEFKLPVTHYFGDYDYRSFYDDETIATVRDLYKEDVEFFNYKY